MTQTIEITLEESFLAEIDSVILSLAMTRTDFTRLALELAVRNKQTIALERQHAEGYKRIPSRPDEFSEWEAEQVWGEP